MQLKRLISVVFSPTGSTGRVAGQLAEKLGLLHTIIDVTKNSDGEHPHIFSMDELVCFGVPSYGGRVPATAVERFAQIRGAATPAILLVTFGNRKYDDTLAELRDLTEANGFVPVAAAALVTEHSIVHQYGAGRPSAADWEELSIFAQSLREKLEATPAVAKAAVYIPGKPPYREYGGVPLKPSAGKECSKCGICARECAAGAIPADNPVETNQERCISCMRCIQVCPHQARLLNPEMLAGVTQRLKEACESPKKNEFII